MSRQNTGQNNNSSKKPKKGQPDHAEKLLEDWNDAFADLINVLVYNGERRVKEENLVDGPTASHFKATEGPYHEKNRDICKEEVQDSTYYVVWGLENQTKVDRLMPVRCMGYDYAAYEWIAKRIQSEYFLRGTGSWPYPPGSLPAGHTRPHYGSPGRT